MQCCTVYLIKRKVRSRFMPMIFFLPKENTYIKFSWLSFVWSYLEKHDAM